MMTSASQRHGWIASFAAVVRRAWLVAGALLLVLLLLEVACRLFAPKPGLPDAVLFTSQKGEPPPEVIQQEYFQEVAASLYPRWRPYVYWGLDPYKGRWINIDEEGLRATWEPEEIQDDQTREVWMFGGSTLWGLGARDDYTIPSLVAKELHRAGVNVRVKNCAMIGYVSTQELLLLGARLRQGKTPAVVLFFDGANDVFSAYFNRRAGVPFLEVVQEQFFASTVWRTGLYRFARYLLWKQFGGAPLEAPLTDPDIDKLAHGVADVYADNVGLTQVLGKARGFESLFYLQPLVFFKKTQTPFEQLAEKRDAFIHIGGFDCYTPATSFGDAFRKSYDQIDSRLRAHGNFHDLRSVGTEGPDLSFIDFCHTVESANGAVARRIADDIRQVLAGLSKKVD